MLTSATAFDQSLQHAYNNLCVLQGVADEIGMKIQILKNRCRVIGKGLSTQRKIGYLEDELSSINVAIDVFEKALDVSADALLQK